jgi:hypothetical protein
VLDSGTTNVSYGRQNYSEVLEAAVNEQINVEYNLSYVYHAMCNYFDRRAACFPASILLAALGSSHRP